MDHSGSPGKLGRRELLKGVGAVAAGAALLQKAVGDEVNPAT